MIYKTQFNDLTIGSAAGSKGSLAAGKLTLPGSTTNNKYHENDDQIISITGLYHNVRYFSSVTGSRENPECG